MQASTSFADQVYTLLRQVPHGRVTTYKALAHALQSRAYRAVGRAMRNNPYAPEVPCHRVVASDGTIGGFKGKTQGIEIIQKRTLLAAEGVPVEHNRVVDFQTRLYTFS